MGKAKAKKGNKQVKKAGGAKKKGGPPPKPVFKVAGAQSLKAKNKTKKVKLNLKKLKVAAKASTEEVDKKLTTAVESSVRNVQSSSRKNKK